MLSNEPYYKKNSTKIRTCTQKEQSIAETDFKRKTRVLRLKFLGKCFKTYRTWLYRFRTRQYKSFPNPRLKKHQKVNSSINSPVFYEKTIFERTWASMNF